MRVGIPRKRRHGLGRQLHLPKITKLLNERRIVIAGVLVSFLVVVGLALNALPVSYAATYGEPQTTKSRSEIQAELNQEVQENMMTVSVSPIMNLGADGLLSCNLENDSTNKFAQRFTITQNDKVVFVSEAVIPGACITSAQTKAAEAGSDLIEIQALDPKSLDAHGSPTVVEVTITSQNV